MADGGSRDQRMKGFSVNLGGYLRRMMGADEDRRTLEAAVLRVSRRLEEFGGTSGRLARLENDVAEVRKAIGWISNRVSDLSDRSKSAAGLNAAVTQLDARLAGLDARLAEMDAAVRQTRQYAEFTEMAAVRAPLYVQPGLNAIVMLGGWSDLPFVVPTTHVGVLKTYHQQGAQSAERGVRALIERELKPGDVAVDIGAHVGVHTVVMGARVRPNGGLYCFEPDPDLAAALQQTYIINGFTHIGAVVNAAVADAPGRLEFFRTAHSPESSLFAPTEAPRRDSITVDVVSLDGYFKPGARVDFLKVDAEGAEAAILRGMKRVLADNPQLRMVMEFAPSHIERAGEDAGVFIDAIGAAGFTIEAIDDPSGQTHAVSKEALLAGETFNLWLTPSA